VKARLFETYHREYENFSHFPGETTDALFQCFVSIVNKMKTNVTVLPYTDHDQAMKLLHSLDRSVWGTKVAKSVSVECSECTTHILDLVALQSKCAALVEERDVVLASLDELKASRVLLSACDACSTLQSKLDEAWAKIIELEKSNVPECKLCLARVDEMD